MIDTWKISKIIYRITEKINCNLKITELSLVKPVPGPNTVSIPWVVDQGFMDKDLSRKIEIEKLKTLG